MDSRRIMTALAAGALAAGIGLSAPAGASASTSPHAAPVAHRTQPGPHPEVNNAWTYTQPDEGGTGTPYACDKGKDYTLTLLPVNSVVNNCEYHIYLQYQSGPALCINPQTTVKSIALPSPIKLQIGPAEGAC